MKWNRFGLIVCTPFIYLGVLVFALVFATYCFGGDWRDVWRETK